MNTTTLNTRQTIETFLQEVMNQQNYPVGEALLSATVRDHHAIILDQPEGDGTALAGIQMLHAAFPDLQVQMLDLIAEGDKAVAYLQISGTNLHPYRRMPATLKAARWEAIAIFRVQEGKIQEVWGSADRMGLLQQLGMLPEM